MIFRTIREINKTCVHDCFIVSILSIFDWNQSNLCSIGWIDFRIYNQYDPYNGHHTPSGYFTFDMVGKLRIVCSQFSYTIFSIYFPRYTNIYTLHVITGWICGWHMRLHHSLWNHIKCLACQTT